MQSILFWLHIKILQSAPLNSTSDKELTTGNPSLIDRILAEIGLKKAAPNNENATYWSIEIRKQ